MHQLSLEAKISIVHGCLVKKRQYKDVAQQHQVKVTLVSYLVKKAKGNKHFLKELRQAEEERKSKRTIVSSEIMAILREE